MRETSRPSSHPLRAPRAGTLPPGTPAWVSRELLEETLRVWQPYYRQKLTLDDAITICSSVGRLFGLLSRG